MEILEPTLNTLQAGPRRVFSEIRRASDKTPRIRFPRIAVFFAAFFVCLAVTGVAFAADFNPYYVISDDNMRAVNSMSEADIQGFLNNLPGPLKSYSAVSYGGGIPGLPGPVEPASRIIFEACQYYQISPKAMLTLLQKEQSLLTRTTLEPTTLDRAIGAGCPDSGGNKYPGFGNQIWNGARLLDGYGEGRGTAGIPLWHPGLVYWFNTSHSVGVTPWNIATFKLYVYNPSIGVSNIGINPDGSGYYGDLAGRNLSGNANFWKIYWNYFGDPFANPRLRPVYRFYNLKTGTHFYTASEVERYAVVRNWPTTYRFEGPAYSLNASNTANTLPLYRFWNKKNGTHFYTASEAEKNDVLSRLGAVYRLDGIAYFVSNTATNAIPVYRFYNVRLGTHFFTASVAERDSVMARLGAVYRFEGIAYYIGN